MIINETEFKKLKSEVVFLRDELAKMKRFYEDLFYNLDDDNFSGTFLKEKNNMKSSIKMNEEGIKTSVKKINDAQEQINGNYESLISEINQTAESIRTYVGKTVSFNGACEVMSTAEMTDTTQIYVIKDYSEDGITIKNAKYYYYNSLLVEWEAIENDSVYSFFEQTADGFQLKGNVIINGNLVKSTDNIGNSIEINNGFFNVIPNGAENPKVQIGFSSANEFSYPYIIFGEGDGNWDIILPNGYPIKSSTGLIFKTENGLSINYTTGGLGLMGIDFLETNTMEFYGNADFSRCSSVTGLDNVTATAVFG